MDALRKALGAPYALLKYEGVSKRFWNIYPFKVSLTRQKGAEFTDLLAETTDKIVGDYKRRVEGTSLSYFFLDVNDAIAFASPFLNKTRLCVFSPENETELKAMDGANVRVRKTLWWGQFRFKAVMIWGVTYMKRDEIESWLDDNVGEDAWIDGTFYPPTFYLQDEKAAVLFKLAWGDSIKFIEEAVLKKDLV